MAPSRNHEVPLVLLSEHHEATRAVLTATLRRADLDGPIEPADPSLSLENVRTLLADRVWLLKDHAHTVRRVAVVEAQRAWDRGKPRTWGAIVGALQGQYGCPVELFVLTGSRRVRDRLARPVRFGGLTVHAHAVTSLDLAALALRTDGADTAAAIATAALRIDDNLLGPEHVHALVRDHTARPPDRPLSLAFAEIVSACALRFPSPDLSEFLRSFMLDIRMFEDGSIMASPQGKALLREFARRQNAEGEARGQAIGQAMGEARRAAHAIVRTLERRGLAVGEDLRARLAACTDLDLLDALFDRAFEVTCAEELFRD